jgi:acetyl esterase
MAEPFDMTSYQEEFPEEPLTGPARRIYEMLLQARPAEKSCARAIQAALEREFPVDVPPQAPQLVVPDELRTRVDVTTAYAPGPDGPVRALLYHPERPGSSSPPALVYFHGGGWSLGNAEEADLLVRKIALLSGCVVASVDYRLAPEHRYPAGLDDCVAWYRWARGEGAGHLGSNPDRVAVGGDSCGGNFAAALTLRVGDEGHRRPDATLLLCPATDFRFEEYESFQRLGYRAFLYDTAFIGAVRGYYAPYPLWDQPYLSPIKGDLRHFPPTHLVAATADPLCDDNHAFHRKLLEAGNPDVELRVYRDMPHAFYYFLGLTREEAECHQAMAAFLRRVLG